jgi:hypothetical protein
LIDDTLLVELAQGLDHETSSLFAVELYTLLVELAQGLDHETSSLSLLWNWTQNQNLEQKKYSSNKVYVLKGDSTSSRHIFWGMALLLYAGVILH